MTRDEWKHKAFEQLGLDPVVVELTGTDVDYQVELTQNLLHKLGELYDQAYEEGKADGEHIGRIMGYAEGGGKF